MKSINGVNEVLGHYDGFILDVWGVLHDGKKPFIGAVECFTKIKSTGKRVVIISNAPRPNTYVESGLLAMGFPVTADQIITSGDMVRKHVMHPGSDFHKKYGSKAYHLGDNNHPLIEGIEIEWVKDPESAEYILGTKFFNSTIPVNSFDDILEKGAKKNIPFVCANPDKIAPTGDGNFNYCCGTLAERYESMGGMVYYCGKPYEPIYQAAGFASGTKVLAVGDTIETDVLGARNSGFDAALVLSGITGRGIDSLSKPVDIQIAKIAKQFGAEPQYFLEEFRW